MLERGVWRVTPWWMFGKARTEVVAWSSRAVKKTLRQARRAAGGSAVGVRVQLQVCMERVVFF
jgi:hypothetical protein